MKILIIEDEPGIREILQAMLELNGYEVLAAADGLEFTWGGQADAEAVT